MSFKVIQCLCTVNGLIFQTESCILRHFSIMELFFFSDHIVIDLGIQVMIGLGYMIQAMQCGYSFADHLKWARTSEVYGGLQAYYELEMK